MSVRTSIVESLESCPSCGGRSLACHGRIHDYAGIAGKQGDLQHGNSALWECRSCHLAFRHPHIPASDLLKAYQDTDINIWTGKASARVDWNAAKTLIEKNSTGSQSVLDIGCFMGGFLAELPNHFCCYGIEPSKKAANHAQDSGVNIVGADYQSLSACDLKFDWITAFDVIEHVHDPADFIVTCAASLAPGGCLIISTGNYHHWSFKLLQNKYYYCAYPEHVSFISSDFVAILAEKLNLKVSSTERFCHSRNNMSAKAVDLVKVFLYLLSPRLFALLRKTGLSNKNLKTNPELTLSPPTWVSARDHFLIVLKQLK